MTLRTHEKGASMVEILGVLAVIATIATGMFTGIGRVNQKIKLTAAVTEVKDIVKGMRTQFSSFSPETVTSKQLYDIGIFKNYGEEDGKTVNVFGKEMRVNFKRDDINHERYFFIEYREIPPNACVDLLLADWGNDPSSGLRSISIVPETAIGTDFHWKKDQPNCGMNIMNQCLLPTLKSALEACAHKDKALNITWTYYI